MANVGKELENKALFMVVAAALIDAQDRVLVQRRPPGKFMAGLWEFPGGKIEPGETPETALVRELHEELGISVAADDFQAAAFASEPLAGRHLVLLLHLCRRWSGAPQALDATEIRWMAPADLPTLDMPPADRPLIALLQKLI